MEKERKRSLARRSSFLVIYPRNGRAVFYRSPIRKRLRQALGTKRNEVASESTWINAHSTQPAFNSAPPKKEMTIISGLLGQLHKGEPTFFLYLKTALTFNSTARQLIVVCPDRRDHRKLDRTLINSMKEPLIDIAKQ